MGYDERINKYFEWLCNRVSTFRARDPVKNHKKLLKQLFSIPFIWVIDLDENRAMDGLSLRYDYAVDHDQGFDDYYNEKCSVLEMMIGLSLRCERDYTGDLINGLAVDRWFWKMIFNIGIIKYTDVSYSEDSVAAKISTMMYREYKPNGKGGLFVIEADNVDIRDMEIWKQMTWYISEQTPEKNRSINRI